MAVLSDADKKDLGDFGAFGQQMALWLSGWAVRPKLILPMTFLNVSAAGALA